MPVTVGSPNESYQIAQTTTNFAAVPPYLTVTFNHIVDGQVVGQPSFQFTTAQMAALFGAPGDGTTPLATWITNAIYNAAVSAGVLSGSVTADTFAGL
jgi:hypothetical protein